MVERIYALMHGGTEAFIKVGELFGFTAGFFIVSLYYSQIALQERSKDQLNSMVNLLW